MQIFLWQVTNFKYEKTFCISIFQTFNLKPIYLKQTEISFLKTCIIKICPSFLKRHYFGCVKNKCFQDKKKDITFIYHYYISIIFTRSTQNCQRSEQRRGIICQWFNYRNYRSHRRGFDSCNRHHGRLLQETDRASEVCKPRSDALYPIH